MDDGLGELGSRAAAAQDAVLRCSAGEALGGHIRAVPVAAAAAAEALAEIVERRGHPPDSPVDRDLLRAACVVHDVDKPLMLDSVHDGG